MSTYLEKIRDAEEAIAGEIVDDRLEEFSSEETMRAAVMLGRAQATDGIAVALSAEVIRFLEHFEKTKLYRALGHKDFVTFLANSGLREVTKNKYYDRKKLLDKEGDPVFEALTVAGVPISVRGMLEAGDVGVDGDTIIVKGDRDADDLVIHKDDHQAIVHALTNQARTRRTAAKEAAALKEQLKAVEQKHDDEKRELYTQIDREKAANRAEVGGDPHSMALASLCFAFASLREQANALPAVDRDARRDNVLEIVANQFNLTRDAYIPDGTVKTAEPVIEGDSFGEALDNFLANERELTAMI